MEQLRSFSFGSSSNCPHICTSLHEYAASRPDEEKVALSRLFCGIKLFVVHISPFFMFLLRRDVFAMSNLRSANKLRTKSQRLLLIKLGL